MSRIPSPESMLSPMPERRACPRIGFDCPVRWNRGGADGVGWARDASESGAGFVARDICAPAVGQKITLVYELEPDLEWVLDENATVVRCDDRPGGLQSVGVLFSNAVLA